MTAARSSSLSWPADRFYWSILDLPPGIAQRIRPGLLPSGLRPMFEEDVPESAQGLADLHAVCAPMDEVRLLVCAVPNAALVELPPDTLALTPSDSDLPAFILGDEEYASSDDGIARSGSAAQAAARLNLLVGTHEPMLFQHARARRTSLALITLILCAGLVSMGLHQRAAHDRSLAADHTRRAHELAASLGRGITPADLPALVGRARQSAAAAANVAKPVDAAKPLAALLAAWPTEHTSTVQSVNIAGDTIAITLTIEGDSAAADFLRAFAAPEGWRLEEPRLTALGSSSARAARSASSSGTSATAADGPPLLTRINLTLRRSAHAASVPTALASPSSLPPAAITAREPRP